MSDEPRLLKDWHLVRPGVWQVRLGDRQDYQIEEATAGFRLQASRVQPPWQGPRPYWVGTDGHAAGWDLPENAPHFPEAQAAVDAAFLHFALISGWHV